ncbi:MAG TPA: hypothetical protein VFZ03_17625 [Dongiaceae bacterium]
MIRRSVLFGMMALAWASGCSSPLKQLPPGLPSASPDVTRDAANGGRVQSIAVDPQDRNHAVIAMQFGGLWRTFNAGETWFRTYTLPAIYVTDVEFAAAGKTVVASVFRDNQVVTGGGIYVSHDGGDDWSRPPTGIVPTCRRVGPADDVTDTDLEPVTSAALAAFPCDAVRTPARTSAYSVSAAPDIRGLWYVGTDFGVAVSADDGATWKHHRIDPSVPLAADRQQDAAQSVLAMPGGIVLALMRGGLYRSDDRGRHWRRVIDDDFSMFAPMGGNTGLSGNKMDRSPSAPWAFIFKKYQPAPAKGSGQVWFYELDTETKTLLPLPQGRSRGPFVRVSKDNASGGQSISVWVGAGWDGYFVTRADAASIRAIRSDAELDDWVSYIAPAGIHADMGDIGLDGDLQRAYVGTDGGIFKPVEEAGSLRLISAAPAGSGMNSLQITDLAGTNVKDGNGRVSATLYFATQDNNIWSSADGGNTWPTNQSNGGEGNSLEVRSDALLGGPVTVGYTNIVASGGAKRFSDALLQNSRPVPELDENGQSLMPALFGAFYLEGAGGTARWFRVRVRPDSLPPSEVFISQNDGSNWRKRFELPFKWKGAIARTNIGAGPVVATSAILATAPDTGAIDRGLMAWVPVETGPTVDTGEGTFNAIGLVRLSDLYANRVDTIAPSKVVRLSGNGSLGTRFTEFDTHAIFGADPFDWRFLIAPDIVNNVVKVSRDGGQTWAIDGALTAQVLKGGKLRMWGGKPDLMSVTEIAFDPYQKRRILVGTRDSGIICSPNNGVTWRTIKDSPHISYVTGFHFRPDGGVYISSYGHGLWFLRAVTGCPEAEDLPWDRKPPIGTGTEATDAFARGPREPATPAPEPASFAELLVASEAGTGTAVLGEDNRLAVTGRGFAPGETVVLTVLDGTLLKKAVRADKGGRFALVIAMPEDFPHGQFTLEAVRKGKAGISPSADFSKGYTDDEEEERALREQEGESESGEPTN